MMVTPAFGSSLRNVSAAITPAGPAPMMMWRILAGRASRRAAGFFFAAAMRRRAADAFVRAAGRRRAGRLSDPAAAFFFFFLRAAMALNQAWWSSKPKARAGFLRGRALRRPAAQPVIFRQHFVEHVGLAPGRAGPRRLGEQAPGQRVIPGGEAGGVVEHAFHVPNAFADLMQFFHRPVALAGRRDL